MQPRSMRQQATSAQSHNSPHIKINKAPLKPHYFTA